MSAHLMAELASYAGQPLDSLHRGQRVLAIAAHPDDEVLGAGGTLIRHFKAGDDGAGPHRLLGRSIRYREGEHDQPADAQRASYFLGAGHRASAFPTSGSTPAATWS